MDNAIDLDGSQSPLPHLESSEGKAYRVLCEKYPFASSKWFNSKYVIAIGTVLIVSIVIITTVVARANVQEAYVEPIVTTPVIELSKIVTQQIYTEKDYFAASTTSTYTTPEPDSIDSPTNGLLLRDRNRIWTYNPKTLKFEVLYETKRNVTTFDVFGNETMFWLETDFPSMVLSTNQRFNSTHHDYQTFFEDSRVKPEAMALDLLTGNLYMVDEAMEALIVVNVITKDCSLLLTGFMKPREIVLDPYQGFLFILQRADSILRLNMDGRDNRNKIVENDAITAITVDHNSRRIYWIEDLFNVKSSDYNGSDVLTVHTDDEMNFASITVVDGKLFWLWASYEHPATLWSCKIRGKACENHEKQVIDEFHDSDVIKAQLYPDYSYDHACKFTNGGCEQLCLLAPGANRSCVCRMGWQLNPDGKTCREVKSFMLYTMRGLVRARILGSMKNVSTDVVWPTPYKSENLMKRDVIDFEYDLKRDEFYFCDDTTIFFTKLRNDVGQKVLLKIDTSDSRPNVYIRSITYDWLTGNLYYSTGPALMVFNVKGVNETKRKVLGHDDSDGSGYGYYGRRRSDNSENTYIFYIIIHPKEGALFSMNKTDDYNGFQMQKISLNTTTTRTALDFTRDISGRSPIALDYNEKKIVYIRGIYSNSMNVHSFDFDGSNAKIIDLHLYEDLKTVYIHQQWMYVSSLRGIWRVNKETGRNLTMIQLGLGLNEKRMQGDFRRLNEFRRIDGLKIISSAVQVNGNVKTDRD